MAKKIKRVVDFSVESTTPETNSSSFWRARYSYEILIFLFSFILYLNSIPNGYNMDDELVTINHRLTSTGISAIPEILNSPYYKDESGYSYEYRPIVHISFAIEHQFFGDNPYISHFFNVILYSLACVLLFIVLGMLFKGYSPLFSLAITLLFTAHNAHTEVVCSIKNRDEILGLLFSLLAFLVALKYVQNSKPLNLFFALLFIILSLLSKLTFAVFALIIPLALIIFYPVNLLALIILSSVLLIPSIYFQNSLGGFEKLFSLFCALFVILFTYFIKNINKKKYASIFSMQYLKFSNTKYSWGNINQQISQRGFFQDILPEFQDFSPRGIFLVSGITIFFFIGFYLNSLIISIIALSGLLILFFRRDANISLLTYCAFYLILLFSFDNLNSLPRNFYLEFFSIPLSFVLVYENRKLFIPTLLTITLLLLFQAAHFTPGGTKIPPTFIYLLCIFFMQYPRGWIISFLFMGINIFITARAISLGTVDVHQKIINQIPFLCISILVAAIYFKKNSGFIAKLYIIAAVLISLLTINQRPQVPVGDIIVNEANKLNPVIMTTRQDRPILYLEQVIDNKTPISVKTGTSLEILFYYAYKVIVPYPLAFYYGYRFIKPMKLEETIPIMSLIIYFILLITALYFINRDIKISFGIFLYLISIALYSNYFYGAPGMIADRFLLVPSLGWIIALVSGIQYAFKIDLSEKIVSLVTIPSPAKYLFLLILLFYSTLTFSRNFDWKDYVTLFRHDIKYVNESAQAHNLLALRLMKNSIDVQLPEKQLEMRQEALMHFKKSVEIYPYFFNTNYDVARVSLILNQPDSAIFYFKKAIQSDSTNIDPFISVGKLLMNQQRYEEAIPYLEYVVRYRPMNYAGYEDLSFAYYSLKRYSQSISVNKGALGLFPNLAGPYINIARTFFTANQLDSARGYAQIALKIDPGNKIANNLLLQWQKR